MKETDADKAIYKAMVGMKRLEMASTTAVVTPENNQSCDCDFPPMLDGDNKCVRCGSDHSPTPENNLSNWDYIKDNIELVAIGKIYLTDGTENILKLMNDKLLNQRKEIVAECVEKIRAFKKDNIALFFPEKETDKIRIGQFCNIQGYNQAIDNIISSLEKENK